MVIDCDIDIVLKGYFSNVWPNVIVSIDNETIFNGTIKELSKISTTKSFAKGKHKLEIYFNNKSPDRFEERDLAVGIESISFNSIATDRMRWAGIYRPFYSAAYIKNKLHQGIIPPKVLESATFLDWNGIWTLEFEEPVFKWVHQIENLGWIYY